MLTNTLVAHYGLLITMLSLLWMASRITTRQYTGAMTVLYAAASVGCAIAGWTSVLYLSIAGAAWFAWMWWNSGCGDDTKRRLKSWSRRFQGVRRTAPAGA
jgi:hypothetical protein